METTQRIFLGNDQYMPHGAKVIGTVIASETGTTGRPAVLTLRFDRIEYQGRTVPIRTRTIAIANSVDVDGTRVPADGSTDRGNANSASWTTQQIGGDLLARSGWIGELVDGQLRRVGFADFHGVYADPPSGATGDYAIPRALGVFSNTAQGLYGFDAGAKLHSVEGNTTISSPRKLVLRSGDNLLQVLPSCEGACDNSSTATQQKN